MLVHEHERHVYTEERYKWKGGTPLENPSTLRSKKAAILAPKTATFSFRNGTTHTSVTPHTVCSCLICRLKRLAKCRSSRVRGRDSGLSLGISACQQRRHAYVPAHRQAAVGQASCGGAVGKLQEQGLCGWPLCATRGYRVGLASCLANLCRFGRDLELLLGCLLRLVRSCSCLLGSRGQIHSRPHSLGCTQCFAGVTPRTQHLPPPQPHTGNTHAQQLPDARCASS